MLYKHSHIFKILKQISFVLVLCVMILQPISQAFSSLTDMNYELVDIDWEDDADKEETNDQLEENEKIRPFITNFSVGLTDLSNHPNHFYNIPIDASYSVEILIPPPELS